MKRPVTIFTLLLFSGGCDSKSIERKVAADLKHIERKVALDAVKSYDLAVKGGDPIDICVHAGLVTAAWNAAHEEALYLSWKNIEKLSCEIVGMPH